MGAFSFRIGGLSTIAKLVLLGTNEVEEVHPNKLHVEVWDEDRFSADDFLGSGNIDFGSAIADPWAWQRHVVQLEKENGGSAGEIILSFSFEPSDHFSNEYVLRLLGVICLATAGALFLVAADCRWQPGGATGDPLKQPGVDAVLIIAALCSFVSCATNFCLAHLPGRLDDSELLAEHLACTGLAQALTQVHNNNANSPVVVHIRPASLTSYELTLDVKLDMRLPTCILAWMLVLASMGLAWVAPILQMQQLSLHVEAGEVCDLLAFISVLSSAFFMAMANSMKRKQRARAERGRKSTLSMFRHSTTMGFSGANAQTRDMPPVNSIASMVLTTASMGTWARPARHAQEGGGGAAPARPGAITAPLLAADA